MHLLDGKKIADSMLFDLKKKITGLGKKPGLAVILVGHDPASELYVKQKAKAAERIGVRFKLLRFTTRVSQQTIINTIDKLNRDGRTDGIIVQLPLPPKFNVQTVINAINPGKDADGFHPDNSKRFLSGQSGVFIVFPLAIVKLIESTRINLKGKGGVVIANSKEFGATMVQALARVNIQAGYILAKELKHKTDIVKKADVVVTAAGKPKLINGGMIKKGTIIIDGGITKTKKGLMGDVDFESVRKVASFLSPVPGGVGPVTIACLLKNVACLSENRIK
jgi:methylenetetrahydrofolate dehydrogenase (NADP+)/methenyltetrahydrofolate cyclohydrolase